MEYEYEAFDDQREVEQAILLTTHITDLIRSDQPKTWTGLYRQYAPQLRAFKANPEAWEICQPVLATLMLEQSLPFAELESPDWIDMYTGEVIQDEEEEFSSLWANRAVPLDQPKNTWPEELWSAVKDDPYLGPGERELAYLASVTGIGYEGVDDDDIEDFDDLSDMEMDEMPVYLQPEMVIDPEIWSIANIQDFHDARGQCFVQMDEAARSHYEETGERLFSGPLAKERRIEFFRDLFEATSEYAEMLAFIRSHFRQDEASTAFIAYKVMDDDWGVKEEDIPDNVLSYIELWEDELAMFGDGMPRKDEVKPSDIVLFSDMYFRDLEASLENAPDNNMLQSKPYNLEYVRAITNGANQAESKRVAMAAWKTRKKFILDIQGGLIVISGDRQISQNLARKLAKEGELKVKKDAPLELKKRIYEFLRRAWRREEIAMLKE